MLDSIFGIHLLDEDFLIYGEDSYEATNFLFVSIIKMTYQGNMPIWGPKIGNMRTTRRDVIDGALLH